MAQPQSNALYRDSIAWQKAMELTGLIYQVTRSFPTDERFGLTNQLRRAAVSIPSNIAEGKGRVSSGEMLQFIGTARGSALEVQTQLEIAVMLGFECGDAIDRAHLLAGEVIRILNASIATMRARTGIKGGDPEFRSLLSAHYCLLSGELCELAINANP